jgi:hypothetical protein
MVVMMPVMMMMMVAMMVPVMMTAPPVRFHDACRRLRLHSFDGLCQCSRRRGLHS